MLSCFHLELVVSDTVFPSSLRNSVICVNTEIYAIRSVGHFIQSLALSYPAMYV